MKSKKIITVPVRIFSQFIFTATMICVSILVGEASANGGSIEDAVLDVKNEESVTHPCFQVDSNMNDISKQQVPIRVCEGEKYMFFQYVFSSQYSQYIGRSVSVGNVLHYSTLESKNRVNKKSMSQGGVVVLAPHDYILEMNQRMVRPSSSIPALVEIPDFSIINMPSTWFKVSSDYKGLKSGDQVRLAGYPFVYIVLYLGQNPITGQGAALLEAQDPSVTDLLVSNKIIKILDSRNSTKSSTPKVIQVLHGYSIFASSQFPSSEFSQVGILLK